MGRKLYLMAFLLMCLQQAGAQSIVKLYGFWRYQPMGNVPLVPDEGGDEKTAPRKQPPHPRNYYIYLQSSSATVPQITKLVIHNKVYTATLQKVTGLPVLYTYFDGQQERSITLVPKGRKNIFMLTLTEADAALKPKVYDMTVEYRLGNTTKKMILAKMKELPAPPVP